MGVRRHIGALQQDGPHLGVRGHQFPGRVRNILLDKLIIQKRFFIQNGRAERRGILHAADDHPAVVAQAGQGQHIVGQARFVGANDADFALRANAAFQHGQLNQTGHNYRHGYRRRNLGLKMDHVATVAGYGAHAHILQFPGRVDDVVGQAFVALLNEPLQGDLGHGAVNHREWIGRGVAHIAGDERRAHVHQNDAHGMAVAFRIFPHLVDGHVRLLVAGAV